MQAITDFLSSSIGQKLAYLTLIIIIILVAVRISKNMATKYINATETRYKTRKSINFIGFLLIFLAIIIIFNNRLNGFTVFIGVAGAGIAFAIKEVIASVAGFLAINFSNFYKVGDRVLLGGIKGDVIDIGFLRTSLMELGEWVDGDLYNGRITRVSNSFVFTEPVFNYSTQFPFLWDEIKVPIMNTGDYEWATEEFSKILHKAQGAYTNSAIRHWEKMTRTMMIEKARIEPMVNLVIDNDGRITFILRYIVDYKSRRTTKDKISRDILNLIRSSNGRIELIKSTLEVTKLNS